MKVNNILLIIFVLWFNIATIQATTQANETTAQIFTYIQNKEWDLASQLATETQNPILIKIVASQRFLDRNYTNNRFEEVIEFVSKNPHWPQISKLKTIAEGYADASTNKAAIIKWFDKNQPQTPQGYKIYALASSPAAGNIIKDQDKLTKVIKEGWIYGNFSMLEEKKYLSLYGKFITQDDHIKRINEHLWQKEIKEAKRLMDSVNQHYKQVFKATIAAIEQSDDKEKLFLQLDPKYYTTSLIYHYLNSNKKQQPTASSINLFKKIKNDHKHANEWCRLQLYYAREFIDYKDFASSYKVISQHFAKDAENIREAEWLSGWLALRFISKPDLALNHFKKLSKVSKKPISIARSKYWLGRTYAALNNQQEAQINYKKAAKYNYTFYGQLSLVALKNNKINLPGSPKIDLSHQQSIKSNELVSAAKLWIKYGSPEVGHLYAKAAMEIAKTPGEAMLIAKIIKDNHDLYYIVEIAKAASYKDAFIKEYGYPTPYNLKNTPVEASLGYAVIRQESVFHPSCKSSAGAMGLMQLIKNTACVTAKSLGMKCEPHKLTHDPKYNILLGTNHLKDLLKKRNNSYILTIASYNADPRKVDRWVNLFGDPRQMKNIYQVIDWIELIPFSETRNYVQRVLENIQVYRTILNKNNSLRIYKDLVQAQ